MKCVLCGGSSFKELFVVSDFRINRCKGCGLVRTFGKQTVSYEQYHRDEDYEIHEKLFRNIFMKRLKFIEKYKSKGKMLEIGAATGTLLDVFSEAGWETHGVEPSGSVEVAKEKGHKMHKTTFEKAKLSGNYYDLVVVNHTLEHVDDPSRVLKKTFKILKKGGILYVDVPNFGSLVSRLKKGRSKYLLPDEHLHHFEKGTLNKTVEEAGFNVVKTTSWSGIFDVGNMLEHFWIGLSSGRAHMYKRFVIDLFNVPVDVVSTVLGVGSNLVVIGKKK